MNALRTKRLLTLAPLGLLLAELMACATSGATQPSGIDASDTLHEPQHQNRRQVYVGVGLGMSQLEPDTTERPGYELAETNSLGGS